MFIPFILWSFSPFVTARKRFYTAVLYARLLMVLVSEWPAGQVAWGFDGIQQGHSDGLDPSVIAGFWLLLGRGQPAATRALGAAHVQDMLLTFVGTPTRPCVAPLTSVPCISLPPCRAACQILRIISFTVTQLPAPNYHCRLGKETAVREMPEHWWGHVVVDVGRQVSASQTFLHCLVAGLHVLQAGRQLACWTLMLYCRLPASRHGRTVTLGSTACDQRAAPRACWYAGCPAPQATHGCGDLIFSSHTTFVLTGVLTFTEYGETLVIMVRLGWFGLAVFVRRCTDDGA